MAVPKFAENAEIYDDDEDTWCNLKTGEIIKMPIHKRKSGEKDFIMVFMEPFYPVMKHVGNAETIVLGYILSCVGKRKNISHGTYQQISKETGVSERSVARAMKRFKEDGFVSCTKGGEWSVNPYMVTYGGYKKRAERYAMFIGEKRNLKNTE